MIMRTLVILNGVGHQTSSRRGTSWCHSHGRVRAEVRMELELGSGVSGVILQPNPCRSDFGLVRFAGGII
jgi:hypothetical protein